MDKRGENIMRIKEGEWDVTVTYNENMEWKKARTENRKTATADTRIGLTTELSFLHLL